MNWRDANDFFAMGGYALYVWGAYGVMAVLMIVEPLLAWQRHRAARAAVADAAQADDEAAPARGATTTAAAAGAPARAAVEGAPVSGARP